MATYLAAVSPSEGHPFTTQPRPTPTPGPDEILIAVKSIALNPADHLMRSGLFIPHYPAVVGFDMSGLVLQVGDQVPSGRFQAGVTRVAAYAAFYWRSFGPDYGAFQEMCLVPWQHAARLPAEGLSWSEAAVLPVAAQVALNAWDIMGISLPLDKSDPSIEGSEAVSAEKKEALLIWGASSSVGSMGVQTGKLLRDRATSPFAAVYATAGTANLDYVSSLGADRVFDYKEDQVVESIIFAARKDALIIRHCFLAVGDLAACQQILVQSLQDHDGGLSQIASGPPIPEDAAEMHGVKTTFIFPSTDEEDRLLQFQGWMDTLGECIADGSLRPSPEPRVVGRGLEAINEGLDQLQGGVSCTKLVVEID